MWLFVASISKAIRNNNGILLGTTLQFPCSEQSKDLSDAWSTAHCKSPGLYKTFRSQHTASGGRSRSHGRRWVPWWDHLSWLCTSIPVALSSVTTVQGLMNCKRPQLVFDGLSTESHERAAQAFGIIFSSRPCLIKLHHPEMSATSPCIHWSIVCCCQWQHQTKDSFWCRDAISWVVSSPHTSNVLPHQFCCCQCNSAQDACSSARLFWFYCGANNISNKP